MNSAQRNENRLTDEDRATIAARITEVIHGWPRDYRPTVGADALALERTAAHSIGCGPHDLRGSELDYISAAVRHAIDTRRATIDARYAR